MPQLVQVQITGNGLKFHREVPYGTALDLMRRIGGEDSDSNWADQLVNDLTSRQEAYLRVLLMEDGWIRNDEVRGVMEREHGISDTNPRTMAGLRSGLTQKAKNLIDDRVDENNWDDDVGQNFYRIKPGYRDEISRALGVSG